MVDFKNVVKRGVVGLPHSLLTPYFINKREQMRL